MVDFTQGRADFNIQSFASVKEGIADASLSSIAEAVEGPTKTIFKTLKAGAKAEAAAKEQALVGDYQRKLLKLADGVAQKKIPSSQARTMARALNSEFIANNPSLTDTISKLHARVVNTTGLGKIIGEKTTEEEAVESMHKAAIQKGYVRLGASVEETNMGIAKMMQAAAQEESIAKKMQVIQLQNAALTTQIKKNTLSKSQADAQKRRQKENMVNVLSDWVPVSLQKVDTHASDILKKLQEKEISSTEAGLAFARLRTQLDLEVREVVTKLDAADAATLMEPVKRMITMYEQVADGSALAKDLKNTKEVLERSADIGYLKDPRIAKEAALARLVPAGAGQLPAEAFKHSMSVILDNAKSDSVPGNAWDGKGDPNTTNKANGDGVSEAIQSEETHPDPDRKQQINNYFNNVLSSTVDYERFIKSPTDLTALYTWLSKPEVGKWLKSNPVETTVANNAIDVLKRKYSTVVLPLIENKWKGLAVGQATGLEESTNRSKEGKSPRDFIDVSFTSGLSFSTTSTNPTDLAAVKELNSEVAPVVNRIVRASSHIMGHTNYANTYAEQFARLFEGEQESKEAVKKVTNKGRPLRVDPDTGERFSEKTVTFPIGDVWYTFPSVDANGNIMSEDQVIDFVKTNGPIDPITGEVFPTFKSSKDAIAYAKARSKGIE